MDASQIHPALFQSPDSTPLSSYTNELIRLENPTPNHPPTDEKITIQFQNMSVDSTSLLDNSNSSSFNNSIGIAGEIGAERPLFSRRNPQCQTCSYRFNRVTGAARYNRFKCPKGGYVCRKCHTKGRTTMTTSIQPPSSSVETISEVTVTPKKRKSPNDDYQLTPEKEEYCVKKMKAEGIGHQGKTRSEGELARVVRMTNSLMEVAPSLSFNQAVNLTSKVELISQKTIRHTMKLFNERGILQLPSEEMTPRITRDDPQHMLFGEGGPSLVVETIIHQCVKRAKECNTYISVMSVIGEVYALTGEEIPRSTMHRWMGELTYEYGEKKLTGLKADYANALIRRYILDYSRWMHEESKRYGQYVLVWMDESYIHTGYCNRYSWFKHDEDDDTVPNRVKGSDKGKRLIIIHAMTRDGMLSMPNVEGSDNLSEKAASAGVVTDQLSAEGFEPEDYHDTLNGEKFLQWVRNRLFVAFEAKYPGKKMVLILDNAKYHHARGVEWIAPSKLTRGDCGIVLRKIKFSQVSHIDSDGKVTSWPESKFTADVKKVKGVHVGGPPLEVMRKAIADWLKSNPENEFNKSLLWHEMKLKKWELLFTPPYESWLQPIELIWGRAKFIVAKQSYDGRKWTETQSQTKAALKEVSQFSIWKVHSSPVMRSR